MLCWLLLYSLVYIIFNFNQFNNNSLDTKWEKWEKGRRARNLKHKRTRTLEKDIDGKRFTFQWHIHWSKLTENIRVFQKEWEGVCSFCDLFLATFDFFNPIFTLFDFSSTKIFTCGIKIKRKLSATWNFRFSALFMTLFSLTLTFPSLLRWVKIHACGA